MSTCVELLSCRCTWELHTLREVSLSPSARVPPTMTRMYVNATAIAVFLA